jgi:hypothetical protein
MLLLSFVSLAMMLTACGGPQIVQTSLPVSSGAAEDRFFTALTALCGRAFSGKLVTNESADADMAGKAMVMHVSDCSASEIRVPFHIRTGKGDATDDEEAAWDRSRTWVVTRQNPVSGLQAGLRLKHDHRHKDGTADAVTQYGGDSIHQSPATSKPVSFGAQRIEFPVDAESIATFRANGLGRSVTNIWALELSSTAFAYELRRNGENARHFRVEFDLTQAVPPPPPAWGQPD